MYSIMCLFLDIGTEVVSRDPNNLYTNYFITTGSSNKQQ